MVNKFSGACHKSFHSREEAKAWIVAQFEGHPPYIHGLDGALREHDF